MSAPQGNDQKGGFTRPLRKNREVDGPAPAEMESEARSRARGPALSALVVPSQGCRTSISGSLREPGSQGA